MNKPNKRAFPRIEATTLQYASFPGGVSVIQNLSVGGTLLKDDDPLPPGSLIRLNLHLEHDTVSCEGVVRWSDPERGMGVQFTEISAYARRSLSNYVLQAGANESRRRLNESLSAAAVEARARTERPATNAPPSAVDRPAPLGELLVRREVITRDQLAAVTTHQRQHAGPFAGTLVELGIVSEDALVTFLQKEYRLPVIDPATVEPTADVLGLFPDALARRHEVLPIGLTGSILTIAIADPSNLAGLKEIRVRSGCELRIVLSPARALQEAIERFYGERARDAG